MWYVCERYEENIETSVQLHEINLHELSYQLLRRWEFIYFVYTGWV